MVKYQQAQLDLIFGALSDPSRRTIVEQLAAGDSSVGKLAGRLPMSQPAVTKHLRVLERSGLLTQTKEGRIRLCQLNRGPLNNAAAWIERYRQFWGERFDDLAKFLEQPSDDEPQTREKRKRKGGKS